MLRGENVGYFLETCVVTHTALLVHGYIGMFFTLVFNAFVLSRSLSLTLVNYFGEITFPPFALTKLMELNFKLGIIHLLQEELCQILILKLKELPFKKKWFSYGNQFSFKQSESNGYAYNCLVS